MSLLELDDIKAHLNLTGDTDDAELQRTLDQAESLIGRKVGPLVPVEKVERLSGYCQVLLLKHVPVSSVTTITGADGVDLDLDLLYLDKTVGSIVYLSPWARFHSTAYTVTYEAGWDEVPDDLKGGVEELVRHLWQPQRGQVARPSLTGQSPLDAAATSSRAGQVPMGDVILPPRVRELIDPYIPLS